MKLGCLRMARLCLSVGALAAALCVACSDDDGQGNDNNNNASNRPPVAVDDTAELAENSEVTIDVLANDTDPDDDSLSLSDVTVPLFGRAELLADDTIRYVPSAHFNGTDTFAYTVDDGRGGTDTATVTVTITPAGEDFFVAVDGDDANPGTIDEPFATLERARSAVRELKNTSGLPAGGVTVWLRGGVYELSETFELGAEDSGTEADPVVFAGYPSETARLSGGRRLDPAAFTLVDANDPVWPRLDSSAQGQVVALDLAAQSVADFGTLVPRGFYDGSASAALELFFNGRPMELARWPDSDEHEPKVSSADTQFTLYGAPNPDVTGVYVAAGTSDGVNLYERQGLVNGLQYRIYRHTWDYQGSTYTAWFVTTNASGYPSDTDPWWYRYEEELGAFNPSAGAGASGTPTTQIPGQINWGFVQVDQALSDTQFTYFGDRPDRWTGAEEVWFHGYWVYHWADRTMSAAGIDTTTRTVTLTDVPGYGIQANQPYYAFNLLEELTRSGEWYLNRDTGILYFWPPDDLASAEIIVSVMETPLVRLNGASWITFQDLTFEAVRGRLVRIDGGDHNTLYRCALRNAGATAAQVSGEDNGLERCEISDPGSGGVDLSGGDRPGLTGGRNVVRNCHIHHFGRFSRTYQPAVRISGVGNVVEHNLMHDAPHSAILYGGNEHRIAYNDIHDVCLWTSDAGAIYAGRDWGYRGNVIEFNFIHHIDSPFEGYGVHGVYLDDCLSGITVFGNLLYEISGHGILHGGGRDNLMENNLMVGCGSALSADSRGINAIVHDGSSWDLLQKIIDMNYQQDPWASAYPALAAIPNDWAQVSDPSAGWLYPEGCVFSHNLGFRNVNFIRENLSGGTGTLNKYAAIQDNVEDQDPLFTDEAAGDLTLSPQSPAFLIPGFVEIPFDQIGIQPEP